MCSKFLFEFFVLISISNFEKNLKMLYEFFQKHLDSPEKHIGHK